MDALLDRLPGLKVFAGLDMAPILASRGLWKAESVEPGQRLWSARDPGRELAIIMDGTLEASLEDVVLGVLQPGELVGEASAFFRGMPRSATVTARDAVSLLAIDGSSLFELRSDHIDVYDALLGASLRTMAARVRRNNMQVARKAAGVIDRPKRPQPTKLQRLKRRFSSKPPVMTGSPALGPLLRRQPGLSRTDDRVIMELSSYFVPSFLTKGTPVFLEGEEATSGCLLGSGTIEVVRNARGNRAEVLSTLSQGAVFGINALIDGGRRTASCVMAADGWVFHMNRSAFVNLRGETGRAASESILLTMASQIRSANQALVRALGGQGDDSFDQLIKAAGHLEGMSLDDERVASINWDLDEFEADGI